MKSRERAGFFNPYPGIESFRDTPEDRALFFSRKLDLKALLALVQLSPQAVLFSRSGLGKTSLIQAGLMEALRKQGFFPFVGRVTSGIQAGPVQSVIRGLKEYCARTGVVISGAGEDTTLWCYLRNATFQRDGKQQKLVLILDQFEELFTRVTPGARTEFIEQLADLIRRRVPESVRQDAERRLAEISEEDPEHDELAKLAYGESVPDVKVLIAVREDYLPELYAMVELIPTIMRHALRLEPFSKPQASEAIVGPTKEVELLGESAFEFEPGTVEEIVDFLSKSVVAGQEVLGQSIDPFQLQILCRSLNERRWNAGKSTIGPADLKGKHGMSELIRVYYSQVCKAFPLVRVGPNARHLWPSSTNLILFNLPRLAVRQLCENGLVILPFGYRNSLAETYINRKFGVARADLDMLGTRKLVRGEARFGTRFYEITHDSLLNTLGRARHERKMVTAVSLVLAVVLTLPLYVVGTSFYDNVRAGFYMRAILNADATPHARAIAIQKYASSEKLDFNFAKQILVGFEDATRSAPPELTFAEVRPWRKAVFDDATLTRISFRKSELDSCDNMLTLDVPFTDTSRPTSKPSCASFAGAKLSEVDFSDARIKTASFSKAQLSQVDFSKARASDASFDYAQLNDVKFSFTRLERANFSHAVMKKTEFERASVEGANFEGAQFAEVKFLSMDLTNAKFAGADLGKTWFDNSNVERADFTGAKVGDADFTGTAWWMASGWSSEQIARLKSKFPPQKYADTEKYNEGLSTRKIRLQYATSPNEKRDALNDIAWYRATRGVDLDAAEREIDQALEGASGPAKAKEYLDTKAFILMQKGRILEAADLLRQALGDASSENRLADSLPYDPVNAEHLYRYALCLELLGKPEEARPFRDGAERRRYKPTYELVLVQAVQAKPR